jgi:hypothetical protein
LYAPTNSRNFFALLFSNRPIKGERRASEASEGTFATLALLPNVGEFSVGHEEFGNEIDVPVVGATVLLPWLAAVVVAVLLEEL